MFRRDFLKSITVVHLFWFLCIFFFGMLFFLYLPMLSYPLVYDSGTLKGYLSNDSNFISIHQFVTTRRSVSILIWQLTRYFGINTPFGFNSTNLTFHLLNTIVLVLLFQILLKRIYLTATTQTKTINICALTGALFWALNPASVYAVAYSVQLSLLVATFFSLLALLFFSRALIQNKTYLFYVAAVFYFLAVHAKEHTVMLPFAFIFIAFWLKKDNDKKIILNLLIPFILYSAIAIHITLAMKGLLLTPYESNSYWALENIRNNSTEGIKHSIVANDTKFYLLSIFNPPEGVLFPASWGVASWCFVFDTP